MQDARATPERVHVAMEAEVFARGSLFDVGGKIVDPLRVFFKSFGIGAFPP
jgi:hypothetical protein